MKFQKHCSTNQRQTSGAQLRRLLPLPAALIAAIAPLHNVYADAEPSTSSGLEEIVVTATKRNENLQDVPMSVNVLTEQDIQRAGILRPGDFLKSIPNITFQEDSTGENFVNIRGQTSSRNSDPNVAIVVDGDEVLVTTMAGAQKVGKLSGAVNQ